MDNSIYTQVFRPRLVNNSLWQSRLVNWFEKTLFEKDVPEHKLSRPENIEHFLTARNQMSQPEISIQGDLMETSWLNPDKQSKYYNFLLVLVDMISSYLFAIPKRSKNVNTVSRVL